MIKINLLPPEKRKKLNKVTPAKKKAAGPALSKMKIGLKFDPLVTLPVAALVIAVVLIGGSFFWLGYKDKSLQERRDSLRVDLNRLNQEILRIDNLKLQTKQVRDRMEVILDVDRNRFLWPRILDEISSALPRYTWLESVTEITPFPQLTLRVEGNTMSNLLLSQLITKLENSSMLRDVRLVSSTEREHASYQTKYFVLEADCTLNQEVPDTTAVAAGTK